ncbi:MAG: serine/threonine-protein kinase [Pirellula sp.]
MRQIIEQCGTNPYSIDVAVRWIEKISLAIQEFHKSGFVHKDLSLANVQLDNDGRAWLFDYGLSVNRFRQRLSGNASSGTGYFIAPEVHRGSQATEESDIWALGVMFFWLVAGRAPFDDKSQVPDARFSIPALRTYAPEAPEYLERLVAKCLKRNPEERYKNLAALLDDLRAGDFEPNCPNFIPDSVAPASDSKRLSIDDLRYHRRWLEYVPNPEVEAAFDRFCNDLRRFVWWGVLGEGGVGKSRTAHELVSRMRQLAWSAGFLRVDSGQAAEKWLIEDSRNWQPRRSTLIVIDYTVRFSHSVVSFLQNLADPAWQSRLGDGTRVRVLLLDRPGATLAPASMEKAQDINSAARVRDSLRACLFIATEKPPRTDSENDLYRNVQEPLIYGHEFLSLKGPPREQWPVILQRVTQKARGSLLSLPELNNKEWWDRIAKLTGQGRPLFLQILGLCFTHHPETLSTLSEGEKGVEVLLDKMLEIERTNRWPECFPDTVKVSTDLLDLVERAIGFITLTRGIDARKHGKTITKISGGTEKVARILPYVLPRILLPNETSAVQLPPFQPDLLGEWLLIKLLRKTPRFEQFFATNSTAVDTEAWLRRSLQIREKDTLETLRLLIHDFPNLSETRIWLKSLIRSRISAERRKVKSFEALQHCTEATVHEGVKDWISGSTVDHEQVFVLTRMYVARSQSSSTQFMRKFWKLVDCNSHCLLDAIHAFFSKNSAGGTTEHHGQESNEQVVEIRRQLANRASSLTMQPGYEEVQHTMVEQFTDGITDAIVLCRDRKDFGSIDAWLKTQADIAEAFNDEIQFVESLSDGYLLAIQGVNEPTEFNRLERWKSSLHLLTVRFPENVVIRRRLAASMADAISELGAAKSFIDVDRWCDELASLAARYPTEEDILHSITAGILAAMDVHGDNGNLAEYERWRSRLTQLANQHGGLDIQRQLMSSFIIGIRAYGTAQQFVEVERLGQQLIEISSQHPDDEAFQVELASGIETITTEYKKANRTSEVERWATLLLPIEYKSTQSRGTIRSIRGSLVKGASNAVRAFCQEANFEKMEQWMEVIMRIAGSCDHLYVHHQLAYCAIQSINAYGDAGRISDADRWYRELLATSVRFDGDKYFREHLADGLVGVILAQVRVKQFTEMERFAAQLTNIASAFPDFEPIQLSMAQGIVNLTIGYALAEMPRDTGRWAEIALELASKHGNNLRIQREFAKVAFNVLAGQFDEPDPSICERWSQVLRDLAERFSSDQEIRLLNAQGAAMCDGYLGSAMPMHYLMRFYNVLVDAAKDYREDEAIQLAVARGARYLTGMCSTNELVEILETSALMLVDIASRFFENVEIQSELSDGACKASWEYGNMRRVNDSERWGRQLVEVANRFPKKIEIQQTLAKLAYFLTSLCAEEENLESVEYWCDVLAVIARRCHELEDVQMFLAGGIVNATNCSAASRRLNELAESLVLIGERFQAEPTIQACVAAGSINLLRIDGQLDLIMQCEWLDRLRIALPHATIEPAIYREMIDEAVQVIRDQKRAVGWEILNALAERWPDILVRDEPGAPRLDQFISELRSELGI